MTDINIRPPSQPSVAGVILAGGRATRMQHQDKGLITFKGHPLVSYALAAMQPLVSELFISANRNHETYQHLGCPVLSDQTNDFAGPLAGILAAMSAATTDLLLVTPCDSPLMTTTHLRRLLEVGMTPDLDGAVAFDGERLHPVFLVLKTALQPDLQRYLASGERKIATWLMQHAIQRVNFSDAAALFVNINSPDDLMALEAQYTANKK